VLTLVFQDGHGEKVLGFQSVGGITSWIPLCVVTSAALVMVAVFGSFALGSDQVMQQLGVGLGAAILIDATIIRAVLLPATMKLLGERNWWLPQRLSWLPKFAHEPEVMPGPA
jgi:RND superfamily putative drug exporter